MLLFQKRFHAGLVDGAVRLTFRQWDKPHVKVGGRYRVHPIGVVEVEGVEQVALSTITDDDARAGGFASRDELLEFMAPVAKKKLTPSTKVFRVALKYGGDGDRVSIALETNLSADDVALIEKRLERFDRDTVWTREVLALIDKHPRIAASQLALKLGRETLPFKVDVRKLKKLGLTQSFEVGYEVSPRGRRFLELSPGKSPKKKSATKAKR
ncbi:MAG: ASCH domain-containing protein [Archangium sp.]